VPQKRHVKPFAQRRRSRKGRHAASSGNQASSSCQLRGYPRRPPGAAWSPSQRHATTRGGRKWIAHLGISRVAPRQIVPPAYHQPTTSQRQRPSRSQHPTGRLQCSVLTTFRLAQAPSYQRIQTGWDLGRGAHSRRDLAQHSIGSGRKPLRLRSAADPRANGERSSERLSIHSRRKRVPHLSRWLPRCVHLRDEAHHGLLLGRPSPHFCHRYESRRLEYRRIPHGRSERLEESGRLRANRRLPQVRE